MITAVAFAALFLLLLVGVPIAFATGAVGLFGFAYLVGWEPALAMTGQTVVDTVANFNLSVLPLFILMGGLFAHSRMADELYDVFHAFLGHRRGGLGMATVLACGSFSAVSGSSLACAATMSKVAIPLMRRYRYEPAFAAATVAAGSTLDILIPPSTTMVILSILTNVNLGRLMIAGVLPGVVMVACFLAAIAMMVAANPAAGPAGERQNWSRRLRVMRPVWAITAVFLVAFGGIYLGVFTPTEAAAIGASSSFLIALLRGRLSVRPVLTLLAEASRVTCMIFFLMIGGLLFANFINVSGAAASLEHWVASLHLPVTALMFAFFGVYLVLGCLLDGSAMLLLTVPIFFPIAVAAGIDLTWFCIFVIIVMGIGMIHPPFGILLFVVKSFAPGTPLGALIRGVFPFVLAEIACVILLILFPGIVTLLPRMMG